MPRLIKVVTRSFIEKTTKKKQTTKKAKTKISRKKNEKNYLNLNAPSNNAKMQSY